MKYRVYLSTGATAIVEVEADDVEAAVEAAWQDVPSSLCRQCARSIDLGDEWDVERDDSGAPIDGVVEPA